MSTDSIVPLAVDFLLKSCAVVVLTWLVLQAWKGASAAQRGWVWCVAFVLLALLPLTRLAAPHWAVWYAEVRVPVKPAALVVPNDVTGIAPVEMASAAQNRSWELPDGVTLGVGVWAAGALLLAAYRGVGTLSLLRCRRASSPLENDAVQSLAAAIRAEFGIARRIELRVSPDCRVPVTWGTWRPVLLLPAEALEWTREWMESALRHELAHVRHYDHLKRLAVFATCIFYWPNPLVWAAAKQLRLAQEEASDNLVPRAGVSAQDYATQLVELIRTASGRGLLAAPGVAMAQASTLEGRLAAILDETRNRGSVDRRLLLVGTIAAAMVGLTFAEIQVRAAQAAVVASEPANPTAPMTGEAALQQKLKSIVFDKVSFNMTDILDVVQLLQIKSKGADPEHLGVNFVVRVTPAVAGQIANAPEIHRQVTLDMTNVSLGKVLDEIARQTNLQYSVQEYAIYLRPAVDDAEVLSVRTYLVPVSFRDELLPPPGHVSEKITVDVTAQLSNWGFLFPKGASATYLPGSGKLVVRDTVKQLDALVEFFAKGSAHASTQDAAAPLANVPTPNDGTVTITADGPNGVQGDVATADVNAVCHFQGCTLTADHLEYNRATKTLIGMRHAKLVNAKGDTTLSYEIIVHDCDKPLEHFETLSQPGT